MKKITALWIVLALAVSLCPAFAETSGEDIFGEIDGDVYENKLLGFGFTLPAGGQWRYKTQEEIRLTNQIAQALTAGEAKTLLEDERYITVMSANDGRSCNIGIEAVDMGDQAAEKKRQDPGAGLEPQADEVKTTQEKTGTENAGISEVTMLIGGREKKVLRMGYSLFGISIFTAQTNLIREPYLVTITVTAMKEDEAKSILENLYWLD